MTAALVAGGLVALCVLMVLRPFASTQHLAALTVPDADQEGDRGGELLRQLRDLDEDLAAGKLDEDDHRRMRGPVEQQAAQVLRRAGKSRVENTRIEKRRVEKNRAGPPPQTGGLRGPGRRVTRVALPAGAALACVFVLLSGALTPRGSGQTITGGAATESSAQTAEPTPQSGTDAQPTPAELAAVDAAEARVRKSPRDAGAHLDLAQAYAGAAAPQLEAIEYLAVLQLDPNNPSANTQLALIAFAAGQAAQAKELVDTALRANPRYPEALYARGLIQLMGLGHPAAAERDLRAYLATAPRGSHRASVESLLAMMSGPRK